MNTFKIKRVSSLVSIKAFHQLPFDIYKNDANWAPHHKQDVESVFDKKRINISVMGNVTVGF